MLTTIKITWHEEVENLTRIGRKTLLNIKLNIAIDRKPKSNVKDGKIHNPIAATHN